MRTSTLLALLLSSLLAAACGSKSGLRVRPLDVVVVPADASDAGDAADVTDARDVLDVADVPDVPDVQCMPVRDNCLRTEICANGADDDCNGLPDDGCPCEPGMVQRCFGGPPGRRNVGVCQDGMQICFATSTGRGAWGACTGGIDPRADVCNGTDNLCNGCSAQRDCPIDCPGPDDPRTPALQPFQTFQLRGSQFYPGLARSWNWRVQGGPCDALNARPTFDLGGPNRETATFTPRLSGDYTVTLTVVTEQGTSLSCSWVSHVEGPGLRVEMCYPENQQIDLDLFLHKPDDTTPWYPVGANAFEITSEACSWSNCEATIRGSDNVTMAPVPRADWGYPRSPLALCDQGPQGTQWSALGFCGNPRLDIDNNLSEGTGLPENINVDTPGDGQTFRIMVENFTGTSGPGGARTPGRPLVNVYCSGRRVATLGAAPDTVPNFIGRPGNTSVGAMWRVADVTTRTTATGATECTVRPLHPAGSTTGYRVTYDDPRY